MPVATESRCTLSAAPLKLKANYGFAIALITLAALLLRLPGLLSDLHSDDYVQSAMLGSVFPAERSRLALYDFGGRTAEDRQRLRDVGWFAWWSSPELELAMFRPLSSALVSVDHAVARRSPWLRHIHSAVFLGLLLSGAAALLRTVLPLRAALLGLVVLAADPSLSVPLSWLANRGALVAGAFGVWAMYAYVRWRRSSQRWAGLAAACGFGLAVSAAESAWAFAGYFVALEWIAGRGTLRERLRGLAIVLGPSLALFACATWLGFGVAGSGLYVSPISDPVRYLEACIERVPLLAAEAMWAAPANWSPRATDWIWGLGAAGLALAVLGASTLWRDASRELRALGAGALLALPLLAGALPEARLLIPVAIGMAAWVAFALSSLLRSVLGSGSIRRRALAAVLLLSLCAVHLGAKPLRAFAAAAAIREKAQAHKRWALAPALDDMATVRQQWFVICANDFTTASILPFLRWFHGRPVPAAYRVLSTAPHAHELRRVDSHAIELTVLGSAVEGRFAGSLWRPRSAPLRAGDEIVSRGLRVRVLKTFRGNPVRVRFGFEVAADHPSHVFLYPGRAGLMRVAVPAVGAAARFAPPHAPRLRRSMPF